jgi:hypothetical protein
MQTEITDLRSQLHKQLSKETPKALTQPVITPSPPPKGQMKTI